MPQNRQVLLARRPNGAPVADDFELAQTDVPEPASGEMLLRTVYLSLDPYMRGRMNAEKSYADPVPVGGVMEGGTVSVVEKSNGGKFAEGDIVVGRTGWQDYMVSDGASLSRSIRLRRQSRPRSACRICQSKVSASLSISVWAYCR